MKQFYPFPGGLHWRYAEQLHRNTMARLTYRGSTKSPKYRNLVTRYYRIQPQLSTLELLYRDQAAKVFAARGVKFNP